ncbi:hypothetical protein AB0J86_20340 [Micromonospora sp. NPDC049559]|uniref:hypothetical protein n=1 Tax=Micromonospora sp. NPDC049559 TaxID=3155923 RepID=UPI0034165AB2
MITSLVDRARALHAAVRRAALAPLLVRLGIFASALLAFLVAYPSQLVLGRPLLPLAVVAALPAISPRRVWPTLTVLAAVAGWILTTSWYGQPVALWRLLALAGLLYLTHALCALGALLPYDAVVTPEPLVRWVGRACGVVLASAVLAVLLLALAGPDGQRTYLTALLGGLAVAVAAAALLAWLLRRR